MNRTTRFLIPTLALVFALTIPFHASAQTLTAQTVAGEIAIPRVSVVGVGPTCESAKEDSLEALQSKYFVLDLSYGNCLCDEIFNPINGNVYIVCSIEARAHVLRKFIFLP